MQLFHLQSLQIPRIFRSVAMSSVSSSNGKKLIKIDVSSDSVCPWCFVGKKHLDKAIASSEDKYNFEVHWRPFILNPSAPTEGVVKKEYIKMKSGAQAPQMIAQMKQLFAGIGMDCDVDGLTGNTMESHRIIYFAGTQGHDKQHKLVEEVYRGYFSEGKYIGDREFLIDCAKRVGIEGAEEFMANPNNGLKEVHEEIRKYSSRISGVPYFVINGKQQLSGAQSPEVFLRAFQIAGSN